MKLHSELNRLFGGKLKIYLKEEIEGLVGELVAVHY